MKFLTLKKVSLFVRRDSSEQKQRDSNLELLRMLAMLMIVAHHFSCHSNMPIWSPFAGSNFFSFVWAQWLLLGGKIGVDVFVMISGYFLITKCGHLRSLLKLLLTTAFYGAGIYLIFTFGKDNFSFEALYQNAMPSSYWFIACYVSLYLISPFLRKGLVTLSRGQYLTLCIVSFLSLTSTQYIPGCDYFKGPLCAFIVCFMIAGFVRLYIKDEAYNSKCIFIVLLALVVSLLLWTVHCDLSGHPDQFFRYADIWQWHTVLISLCLLLLFRKLHIGHIAFINKCGGGMLGVYLLHDNNYIRPWLWNHAVHVAKHLDTLLFPLWSIWVILAVFITCCMIEILKQSFIDPLINFILKPFTKLDDKLVKFLS